MTKSYTRQSSFSNGDVIDAPLFNAEFDQLVAAFHEATGHNHDGTAAGGAPVPLIAKDTHGVRVDTNDPLNPKIVFKIDGVDVYSIDSATIADTTQIEHTGFGNTLSLKDYLDTLGNPDNLITDSTDLEHTPFDTGITVFLKPHLDELDLTIDSIEANIATNLSSINTLTTDLNTLEGRANNLDLSIDSIEANIATNLSSINTLTTDLNTLEGRVDSLDVNNGSFETRVTTLETEMNAVESRATTLETEMNAVESRATTLETEMNAVESRATTLETEMNAVESRATTLETEMNAVESRATNLETFEAQAGTAYTKDVQTSELDTTSGALMSVGAFGLGKLASCPTWPNTSLNDVTGVGAGSYRGVGTNTDRPMSQNGVIWFSVMSSSSIEYAQIFIPADAGETGSMYIRSSSGGTVANPTWSAWREVWTDGNLVKTTSPTDSTAGRMLKVGDFGLGAVDNIGNLLTNPDLDTVRKTGFYFYTGATNAPTESPDGHLIVNSNRGANDSHCAQFVIDWNSDLAYFRRRVNNVWSGWVEYWTTANLVKTTSSTDSTSGRMLQVGDFGLGKSITYGSTDDTENLLKEPHFWDWDTSSNAPSNVPVTSAHSGLRAGSAGRFIDIIGQTQGGSTIDGGLRWRQYDSAYGDWKEIWDSSNLVKTTEYDDTTDLRVPVVRTTGGIFGLGNEGNMSSFGNFNVLRPTGFWGTNGGEANSPILSGIVNVLNMRESVNVQTQFALRASTGSDIRGWIRGTDNGTTYTNWAELWHSENLPVTVDGSDNVDFPANLSEQGERVYSPNNPNTRTFNTSSTFTHTVQSRLDIINHYTTSNTTITVSNTGVSAGQMVKIIKAYNSGSLTINATNIIYPDQSTDSSAVIDAGLSATVTLIRDNSNTAWILSVN